MLKTRNLSKFDNLLINLDQGLRTLLHNPQTTDRPYPAANIQEAELNESERKKSAAFMRINHAGEVSAQALYQGQALTASLEATREHMQQAAMEENDHLAWCKQRLTELGSHTSVLSPLWYVGSFTIGATAGLIGDKWSLGFVAETEQQVVKHLESHICELPEQDKKSTHILIQMREDEAQHRDEANKAGAAELPYLIKKLMGITSKVMTKTAYWI